MKEVFAFDAVMTEWYFRDGWPSEYAGYEVKPEDRATRSGHVTLRPSEGMTVDYNKKYVVKVFEVSE